MSQCGVFGVIDDSAVTYGGYKQLQQAGVPVTGGAYDGPEWYQQPNTNMFSISGPGAAKDPQYDNFAVFAKHHGGTKCAALGYGISPSSQASASGFELSCEREGLKNALLDTSVPFGTVNVTTLVLQIKASGANVLWLPLDGNTNFAIMTGLKQAGVKIKVVINATGKSSSTTPARSPTPRALGFWRPASPSSPRPPRRRPSSRYWPSTPTTPAFLTSPGTRDGVVPIS
jgi:branched-chain amino acid transport system substrate-binding protein